MTMLKPVSIAFIIIITRDAAEVEYAASRRPLLALWQLSVVAVDGTRVRVCV